MPTPLKEIYKPFLAQIDDDILALIEQDVVEDMLLTYLKGATIEFDKCKKDLTINEPSMENNYEGCIVDSLDLDEIFILSRGMIVYWLQPKILREDNLKSMLTDHDYNQKSPANLLDKLLKLKQECEKDLVKRKRKYTYKGFKGWN